MDTTTTDGRMLQLIEMLQAKGIIRFEKEFTDAIGMQKQVLPAIKRGAQSFRVHHIQKACELYKVNANWIFGLQNTPFRAKTT